MSVTNNRARYVSVAMALHWLIAAAILFNICLGLYVANVVSDNDPSHFPLIQLHKSVGLSVLVLSLARLGWRLANPVPPLPDTLSPGLKALAHGTHYLLYVLIIVIPLSGWAYVSSSPLGLSTPFFGLFHWPNVPIFAALTRAQKNPLHHELFAVHSWLAFSAIALVVLHVVGALYHQIQGDDVLRRMVPGTRVRGET